MNKDPGVELFSDGITAPEFAFLGAETMINTMVTNPHRNAIGPFEVAVEVADNQEMNGAVEIGVTTVTLPGFASQTVSVPSVVPSGTGEASVWFRAVVDSTNMIGESNESNNVSVAGNPTRMLVGAPDVAVTAVRASATEVAAGGSIDVVSTIRNVGGEVATDVQYAVMLSTNPVISARDVQLDTWTQTLQPTETFTSTRTVTIPAGANSGVYYIGVLADSAEAVVELNESNNGLAAYNSLLLSGNALAVTTTALPRGYVDEPYEALLSANGAAPPFTWTISTGQLPAGIRLDSATGALSGSPTTEETQSFTVGVTSADGQQASLPLSIAVEVPGFPLTIVTRGVPGTVVGQEYEFEFVATGAAPGATLTWTVMNAPEGFAFDDAGMLRGVATMAGTFDMTVSVTDGTDTANRGVQLVVRDNDNLLIVPQALPDAVVGTAYSVTFEATGGVQPLTWLVGQGSLPEGLNMNANGVLEGTPTEVGSFEFTVDVLDGATGSFPARDSNAFTLTVASDGTFTVDTAMLAVAYVGESYDQTITVSGGLPPYTVEIVDSELPDGLLSNPDAVAGGVRIVGQPTAEGLTQLLVHAEDAQGRITERVLALQVLPAPVLEPVDEDGCRCVGEPSNSRPALLGFGLLALALVRRRRR